MHTGAGRWYLGATLPLLRILTFFGVAGLSLHPEPPGGPLSGKLGRMAPLLMAKLRVGSLEACLLQQVNAESHSIKENRLRDKNALAAWTMANKPVCRSRHQFESWENLHLFRQMFLLFNNLNFKPLQRPLV